MLQSSLRRHLSRGQCARELFPGNREYQRGLSQHLGADPDRRHATAYQRGPARRIYRRHHHRPGPGAHDPDRPTVRSHRVPGKLRAHHDGERPQQLSVAAAEPRPDAGAARRRTGAIRRLAHPDAAATEPDHAGADRAHYPAGGRADRQRRQSRPDALCLDQYRPQRRLVLSAQFLSVGRCLQQECERLHRPGLNPAEHQRGDRSHYRAAGYLHHDHQRQRPASQCLWCRGRHPARIRRQRLRLPGQCHAGGHRQALQSAGPDGQRVRGDGAGQLCQPGGLL